MTRRKKVDLVLDAAQVQAAATKDAAARRQKLADIRLQQRDAIQEKLPEYARAAQVLLDLGDGCADKGLRREVLDLAHKIGGICSDIHERVEMLSVPGMGELLLPFGVSNRLYEVGFRTVDQLRADLTEDAPLMRRAPALGAVSIELVRTHIEAFDAGMAPPEKPKRGTKVVTLTKRETLLAQKMGLTPEKAAELLGRGGA